MKDKEWIKQMILAHHEHLTQGDLAEECGCSAATISAYSKELGIKPITGAQQSMTFVQDMHTKKTIKEIAAILEVEESYVEILLRKLGLECIKKPAAVESITSPKRKITIGQSLGSVHEDLKRTAGTEGLHYEYQGI